MGIDAKEIGQTGLNQWMGYVHEAYNAELRWPSVQPLYSRLRRSDPEVVVARNVFTSMARSVSVDWQLPDKPNDADKRAQEFAQTIFEDMPGGETKFIDTLVSQVPFFGWGWWEVLPGIRLKKWTMDGWQSEYTDGLIGIRNLAWRDTSTFGKWIFDDKGKLTGMEQRIDFAKAVQIPLEKSLHLTFGDAHNPEGLSPLEAIWRLERIKYGLEVVQGIGFEHSAGYLDVKVEQALSDKDTVALKAAARNVMTAQEGNFAAWPKGVTGELKDVSFSAASSILEAIRYFGLLKLLVFNMQWVGMANIASTGALSAVQDSSEMFLITYNAMMDGFAKQIDEQIGKRLFAWNATAFAGMTARPKFRFTPVQKSINLSELGQFIGAMGFENLGPEDWIEIRRRSGFLPETLPELNSKPVQDDKPEDDGKMPERNDEPEEEPTTSEKADMARRPFKVDDNELPDDISGDANITETDVNRAMKKFEAWAKENAPEFANLLKAKPRKKKDGK